MILFDGYYYSEVFMQLLVTYVTNDNFQNNRTLQWKKLDVNVAPLLNDK
jgi:hypothetical protein